MSDVIHLLPDSIANQIAAGEVIQRPASVVKELMENALDADGTEIRLIIKDSGKTLIQVVDNGSGMSETDARKSFERHATSKIRQAKDLFSIRTMGFRGEALASIAAIAHVELITRLADDELGTRIVIEGSKLKKQEACQSPVGTSISVKNLFFNVPARRKFLKSDPVELRHIMDEFHRIALSRPNCFLSLHHNTNEVYHLPPTKLRQRVVNIFGKSVNEKIIPVEESTEFVEINGYVGKPEFSKKSRGDQYLFVNGRYVRSAYLAHAVRGAYEELIPKEHHPFYVLFLEMDPEKIDINVHPTKHEIKFEDERLVYNYLKVTIRHALGRYSVTPTIDFDRDVSFDFISNRGNAGADDRPTGHATPRVERPSADERAHWEQLYRDLANTQPSGDDAATITMESQWGADTQELGENAYERRSFQVHQALIISPIKSGFLVIDQQAAHERILYEKHLSALQRQERLVQKELFPQTVEFDAQKSEMLSAILDKINALGFSIEDFGKNTFIIHGVPVGLHSSIHSKPLLESLIRQYGDNLEFQLGIDENLARSLAVSAAIKRGQALTSDEMMELIDQLFACSVPYKSPTGRKCFITLELDEIYKRLIE